MTVNPRLGLAPGASTAELFGCPRCGWVMRLDDEHDLRWLAKEFRKLAKLCEIRAAAAQQKEAV